jgi:hypothetical protein
VRPVLVLVTLVATLVAGLGLAAPAAGSETPLKVAIIVGPVGEELTPTYLSLADAAADAAETRGATVARAYSPTATAEKVLTAVEGASIVVYLGHGVGTPNPYSDEVSAQTMNGWGLNGPGSDGVGHADSVADGALAYYGEAWIAEHARPAPGWVMIYSNACYAPGAGEGQHARADQAIAAERVSAYSRAPLADLGASAYFATDYYAGAAHLVGTLLDRPDLPYGEVFASEPNYIADGLTRLPHGLLDGAETWLHRSAYFEGITDYWYAFAGDPTGSLGIGHGLGPRWQPGMTVPEAGLVAGVAMAYPESPGHEGQATVALPPELAAALPAGESTVRVCATRCADLVVVASLPSQPPGAEQPILAISQHGWALISDEPLSGTALRVSVRVHDPPPRPDAVATPTPPRVAPSSLVAPPPVPAPILPPASPAPTIPAPTPSPSAQPTPSPTPDAPSPAPSPSAAASPSVPSLPPSASASAPPTVP